MLAVFIPVAGAFTRTQILSEHSKILFASYIFKAKQVSVVAVKVKLSTLDNPLLHTLFVVIHGPASIFISSIPQLSQQEPEPNFWIHLKRVVLLIAAVGIGTV